MRDFTMAGSNIPNLVKHTSWGKFRYCIPALASHTHLVPERGDFFLPLPFPAPIGQPNLYASGKRNPST